MPKQIKKRATKKAADTETEVKDKLTIFKDVLRHQKKSFIKYGIAVFVAIVLIISFLIYFFSLQKTAKHLEYEAYSTFYNEHQNTTISEKERFEKALDIFQKSYKSKKSPLPLFYIASCYYELGKYDEALNTLKDFIKRYSDENTMIPLAYAKLAQVYQQKGEKDEALNSLDTLAHLKSSIYTDFALMETGRILEKEGRSDEAKKKFNEIATRFPNSPFTEEVKAKLSKKKKG